MAESADNKAFVDEDNVKIFESKVVPLSASVDKDTESTKSTKSSKSEQKNDETKPTGPPPVPFLSLYKYTSTSEKALLVFALVVAAGHGTFLPLLFSVMGGMIDDYQGFETFTPCGLSCVPCTQAGLYNGGCVCSGPDNCNFYEEVSDTLPEKLFEDEIASYCLENPMQQIYNSTQCDEAVGNVILQDLKTKQLVFCYYYAFAGVIVFFLASIHSSIFTNTASKIVARIESKFFKALVSQEMAFFDENPPAEFNNRLTDDTYYIKTGTGDKVTQTFQFFGQFCAGMVIGFTHSWSLSLVIIGASPLLIGSMILLVSGIQKSLQIKQDAYAQAGRIAEEIVGFIRTVQSFGGGRAESTRYLKECEKSTEAERKQGISTSLGFAILFFCIFLLYAIAFSFGTFLYTSPNTSISLSGGDILSAFFAMFIGLFSLTLMTTNVQYFTEARTAAARIYEVIERESLINPLDTKTLPDRKSESKAGMKVELKNVEFSYPTRKEQSILKGLDMVIEPGKTVALVGASGGGKSTVIGLVQRLYDVNSGEILVDGENVKDINVRSLRKDIGIVSQEPVLFATSIIENIRYGLKDISEKDVYAACEKANCHEFISKLPKGYNTFVGARGTQLSGGQKQRIAIARAIVRKPKLLLLDEATSALDANSEKLVQTALNKISSMCTTIIIAHRLSTVRNADKIMALREGKLVEQGTHEELIKLEGGLYQALVAAQAEAGWEDKKNEEKEMSGDKRKQLVSVSKSIGMEKQMSVKKEETTKKPDEEEYPEVSMATVLKLNSPEWVLIVVGMIGSLVAGAAAPLNSILFVEFLTVFETKPCSDGGCANATEECVLFGGQDLSQVTRDCYIWNQALPWVLAYVLMACAMGIATYVKTLCFTWSGLALTKRLRGKYFQATVDQDIAYFDDPNHTPGLICSRLSTDCTKVSGVTGIRLGMICQSGFTMVTCLFIGFYYSWTLTLVLFLVAPLMIMGSYIETKYQINLRTKKDKTDSDIEVEDKSEAQRANDRFREVAYETMSNIRTVAMLSLEDQCLSEFNTGLDYNHRGDLKMAALRGFSYAFSSSMIFFAFAATFRFGLYLIIDAPESLRIDYSDMQRVMMALVFGASEIGQQGSMAPDYAEAKMAANRIFAMFNRVPSIDVHSDSGEQVDKTDVQGRNVEFTYPTRPEVQVLKKIDFEIQQNKTVALVGQSGCGKSTIFQLLQRFYDVDSGKLEIGGVEIKNAKLDDLRNNYGLVQQEPVLFSRTIADNIRYGVIDSMKVPDESDETARLKYDEHESLGKHVSDADVVIAAKKANAHDFIMDLPEKYETLLVEGQLSGGQKQRVAIARALIRAPKVLLLDEATSALDTESEKLVMDALEKARANRTCLMIAHRLSTVRSADQIFVIDNGKVVEQGGHHELIKKEGVYFNLVQAQL